MKGLRSNYRCEEEVGASLSLNKKQAISPFNYGSKSLSVNVVIFKKNKNFKNINS